MLNALAILFVFQLLGEVAVQWLALPLPGPVVGMLLLFTALLLRGGVPEPLQQTAGALLQNLMLLFIPAVSGVMLHFERVGKEWLPILLAGVGGAAITIAVTALATRALVGRSAERQQ
jgi:holin-like protein